jgi:hypothetical protein
MEIWIISRHISLFINSKKSDGTLLQDLWNCKKSGLRHAGSKLFKNLTTMFMHV